MQLPTHQWIILFVDISPFVVRGKLGSRFFRFVGIFAGSKPPLAFKSFKAMKLSESSLNV